MVSFATICTCQPQGFLAPPEGRIIGRAARSHASADDTSRPFDGLVDAQTLGGLCLLDRSQLTDAPAVNGARPALLRA